MSLRRKFALTFLLAGLVLLFGGGRSLVWFRSWRAAEALVADIEALGREIPRRTPYLVETIPGTFSQCAMPLLAQASAFEATRDALERANCATEPKVACFEMLNEPARAWVQSITVCGRSADPETLTFLEANSETLATLKGQVQTLQVLAAAEIDRRAFEGKPAEALSLCADTGALARDLVFREQLDGLPLARDLMLGVWWSCTRAIDIAPADRKRRFARQNEIIRWGLPPRVRLLREAGARFALDVFGGLLSDGQKSLLPKRAQVLANQRGPEQSPSSRVKWQFVFPIWQRALRVTLDFANELPVVRRVYLSEAEELFRPHLDPPALPRGPDFEAALSLYDQLNAILQAFDVTAMIDAEGWSKDVLLALRTGAQKPLEATPSGADLVLTFKESAFQAFAITLHRDEPLVPAAQ